MREPRLSARIVAPSRLDASLVALWDRLNREVPGLASPFLSVHYARAVEAAGVMVRVCVIERDGEPAAFLPFQFANRLAALAGDAEPVGANMTDYVGLVAPPDLRIEPARLLKLARLNNFVFTHLDESQLGYGLSGEQPRIGLRLRIDPADPLMGSKREQHTYLKDTERRARQLTRDAGELRFVFDRRDNVHELLDQLVASKRAQYQRTDAADALAAPWTTQLLHALADTREAGCSGVLSTLYAGDTWIASHFGLMGNGMLQVWLPVYNPEFPRYAPGRLLTHRLIESCPAAGLHTVDRGEGDTPTKRQLANEEHLYLRGAWHNRSLASYVNRSIHSLKWRLQS